MPGPSAASGIAQAVGDQRAVFPFHQRPCLADEIPHLSPEGAIRLPSASDRRASEKRDRELALGSPGSQAVEYLQCPHVKDVGVAGSNPVTPTTCSCTGAHQQGCRLYRILRPQ